MDFDKTFSDETWLWLKQEASKGLKKWMDGDMVSPNVVNHWLKIVGGEKPFGYVTESEYKENRCHEPLKTQADVLKAWKEGKLVYKER